MMPRLCLLYILLGTLLLASPVFAQSEPDLWVHPDYNIQQWTMTEGLPSNTIYGLFQTSDGYLWIGTSEGLARFDGKQFTTFNFIDTPSLRDESIQDFYEGPTGHLWIINISEDVTLYQDGHFTPFEIVVPNRHNTFFAEADTMWIGTTQGVMRYAEGRMEPYRQDLIDWPVHNIARDSQGRLWIGSPQEGLHRLDPDGELTHVTAADGLPSSTVQNVLLDDYDVVWIGMQGGIARINGNQIASWLGATQAFYHIQATDAEGGAWFTTSYEGWRYYDPRGEVTFYPLSNPHSQPHTDEWLYIPIRLDPQGNGWHSETADVSYRVQGGYDGIFREGERMFGVGDRLNTYTFDRDGTIWVGTNSFGLLQLRPTMFRTIGMEEGLPFRSTNGVFEDQQGDFLISVVGMGVVRLDAQGSVSSVASHPDPWVVYEDRAGSIWIGSSQPLCRVEQGQCRVVDVPLPQTYTVNVQSLYEDRQGRFWVGANAGLSVRQDVGGVQQWTPVVNQQGESALMYAGVRVENADGTLFFSTREFFDPDGQGLLRYPSQPTTRPPRPTEGQPEPGTDSYAIDPNDFESMTTTDGLPSNMVNDVHEDHEGYLWLALEKGLCRLDRGNQPTLISAELACIDNRSGLHHHNLKQIVEDDQGRFWFNSSGGIFWIERAMLNAYFSGETSAVASMSYTEADGLGSRRGSTGGIKASDGRIWFPTDDGMVIIDPEEVPWPEAPPVILEAVQIAEEVRQAPEALVLKADERDVSFQFTAPEFTQPDDVQFQYWLEGYDDTWRDAGGQRLATYTNLSPGNYTFRVRSGLAGLWSEAVSLEIEREPYFWQTTWFLVLVGLVLLSAGPVIYTFRLRQLKAREAELERVVDERTAELQRANELKSRFLANISHEFRTPLTLTFGPIDDLLNGRFGPIEPARPHFERARRNGHRLLRLINQLLDLSKLDAGALLLHLRPYDLAQHLRQMTALFESLSVNKGLHLHTEISQEPVMHVYDADKIEKVVINLLSNAFKFTPPGGKISLTFEQEEDGTACIEVADTGPGIAKEDLPQLFDRFYQVDSDVSRAHEGSGIGLSLVKEMVELHQGTVTVKSKVGFGTRFAVRLPLLDTDMAPEYPATHQPEEQARQAHVLELTPTEETAPAEATQSKTQNPKSEIEETVVLVVEDNPDMRAYIRAHLEDRFRVIEAENGKVGVERAQEEVPDLILSDVMMPVMDGLEACAALKKDERTSHIPVVLLTARATVEHRIEGFESGADAYLPKPFNAEELQVRVRTMVEERRRLRALFAGTSTPSRPPLEEEIAGDGAEAVVEEPVRPMLPPREAAFVEKVASLIEEHLGDSQFGVDMLAEMVSMSRRQVHRKLVALTDETPAVMIRRRRMERAAELLREGGLSMKEVSYAVGFQSESSFGRAFRQAYGVAPSEYAERAV